MSRTSIFVEASLQHPEDHILEPGEVDDVGFGAAVNITIAQFSRAKLEKANWQFIERKLIDVANGNPLFNLAWNEHIVNDVSRDEVVERAKVVGSDFIIVYHLA